MEMSETINRKPMNEMAYPVLFDINVFKSLKSFSKRIQYCEKFLQRIASGSARIVYKIDDEKVLKLAKNAKGIAQNEVEGGDYYLQKIGCFAKTFDVDENYLWVEMQLARKAKISDFKRITGFDFYTICAWCDYVSPNLYNHIDERMKQLFQSDEFQEYIDDYDGLFYQLNDYIGNYQLKHIGDLKRISSWGVIIEDGEEKLVLVDYGFNDDVAKRYY